MVYSLCLFTVDLLVNCSGTGTRTASVPVIVSVIVPVYNGEAFLEECLDSIKGQRIPPLEQSTAHSFNIQVSIYDDASSDTTPQIIQTWTRNLQDFDLNCTGEPQDAFDRFTFSVVSRRNDSGKPRGVGFAKNRAIEQSTGEFLCFCDADDVMLPDRIFKQLDLVLQFPDALVGSQFRRIPEDSTRNYTYWANSLSQHQLSTQVFCSFGPTIIMPTWFCHRSVFNKVPGGFSEVERGFPEDLDFFYKHLDLGGSVYRVDLPLLKYRFNFSGATYSVNEDSIRTLRLDRLESKILRRWKSFSIWNAGKLGRRFYKSLKSENQAKVVSFYDVDTRKIDYGHYQPHPSPRKIPIRHARDARSPIVICVKTELTFDSDGPFQTILKSLHLVEGVGYVYFN